MNLSPLPLQKFFDNNGAPLVGGQLFTYVVGTTTKIATYKDQAGTLNTNPIILDYRGEANVWLDQTLVYKFVLAPAGDTDPPTRPIWTVDNISAAVTYASLTASIIGQILYPKDATENAQNISVVNFQYPYGDVDRYGTNATPGTTVMTVAFNAAAKYCKNSGHDMTYGRTWPYLLDATIDMTQAAGSTQYGFSVRNVGQVDASTNTPPASTSIRANHTGFVFDCSGAIAINWYDASVGTVTGGSEPQGVWFCARNSAGSSCVHRWNNSRVLGKFSKAIRYLYGIEENDAVGEFLDNITTTAGACVEIQTTNNILSLSSGFITIATGPQSQRANRRFGGSYIMPNGSATSDIFLLDQVEHCYILNSFFANPGRSGIAADATNGASNFCHISGVEMENGIEPAYGILFVAAGSPVTHSGWTIENSYLRSDTRAVFAGANVTLDSLKYANITEAASRGFEITATLQASNVFMPSQLIAGTSSRNFLVGVKVNMTLTSRSNDLIVDTFTGSIDGKGSLTMAGAFGCNGATAQAAVAGFGAPTGALVIANFPGATATLVQTSQTVAEILTILKANGQIAA